MQTKLLNLDFVVFKLDRSKTFAQETKDKEDLITPNWVEKDLEKAFREVNNSNLKMGRGAIGGVLFPKCCCCIDLKTGVVVLGVLSAIAAENAMIGFSPLSGLGNINNILITNFLENLNFAGDI